MPTITIDDTDRGLVEVYEDLRLRAEPNSSGSWRVLQGGRVMASRVQHLVLSDARFNAATLSGYVDFDEGRTGERSSAEMALGTTESGGSLSPSESSWMAVAASSSQSPKTGPETKPVLVFRGNDIHN